VLFKLKVIEKVNGVWQVVFESGHFDWKRHKLPVILNARKIGENHYAV
jgi:hypothetical protein